MSGFEVIGAITGISQLADSSLRLGRTVLDLYSTVKNNSVVIQRRRATIEDLNEILHIVKSSPGLQMQRTGQLLQNIIDRTKRLEHILTKLQTQSESPVKRYLKGYIIEKQIVSIFDELGFDKTNLIIHIVSIDANCLRNLDSRFSDNAIAITRLDKGLAEIKGAIKEIKDYPRVVPEFGALEPQESVGPRTSSNEGQKNIPTIESSFDNIPQNQVFDFVGQTERLTAMEMACQRGSVIGTVMVLIGMAGSGKTQLAMRFCRSQRQPYKFILWADASSLASLERSYVNIANIIPQRCSASAADMDSKKRIAYLKDVLVRASQPWILVLDNYDDPEEFHDIQSFIPYTELGVVIITSRHHETARLGTYIELNGMNEHDALTLLHKRSRHDRTESTETVANAIVHRLGYLPLAIDQAGSYIRNQRVTLNHFLAHYEQEKLSVLCHTPKIWEYCKKPSGADIEAKVCVFNTWEMVFQRLEAKKPALASLISLAGYFCHSSIDEALLKNFMAHCGSVPVTPEQCGKPGHVGAFDSLRVFLDENGVWDSAAFRESLAELADNCLIENFKVKSDSMAKFSLHPLISDWIKIRSDESSNCGRYEHVCKITACFLHTDQFKDCSQDAKIAILGHLDGFMAYEKTCRCGSLKLGLGPLRRSGLVSANFYHEQGRYANATALYEQVIDDCATLSEECLEAMKNYSRSLHCLGLYQMAEKVCKNSLKALEEQFGPTDLRTLAQMEVWANIHRSQARYQEAEILYLKILKGRQDHLGNDHDETLSVMANLANIYRSKGTYDKAAISYQNLATLLPSDQIQRRRRLLWIINDHASFLQSQVELQQAEQLYKEVLKFREEILGEQHPDTLWTLADLANNYKTQEKYQEAELAYKRARDGLEQQLGGDHPETLWAADGLGNVYCSQHRLEEAERILEQVLKDRERQLGCCHHNTLRTVHGLGDVYLLQNRFLDSRSLYERAVDVLTDKLGHKHPKTLAVVEKLAMNRQMQGDLQEAETLLRRVLDGRISCLGNGHPDIVKSVQKLARVRSEINNL